MLNSVGILGTIFVLISFLMKDVKKIRIVNIIGAILFVIYGIYTHTLATWLLNSCLIIIHIFYLVRERINLSITKRKK